MALTEENYRLRNGRRKPACHAGPPVGLVIALPTIDGAALAADGRAEISEEIAWQRLFVEVTANVADGTVFTLILNGRPFAPIVVSGSAGDFEIAASEGQPLPNGLHHVGQVETLAVATKEGALILTGEFARSRRAARAR